MKKKSFSAIIAVSAFLFIAGYLFGCSDDKDSGGYLSCSEAARVSNTCESGSYDCPPSGYDGHTECLDKAIDKCLVKEMCGGNNLNACYAHYESECPEID